MESVYLLIPVSVILVFLIAYIFWWSVRSGQFDDLEGPGYRLIMEDEDRPKSAPGAVAPETPAMPPPDSPPPKQ